MDFKPVPIAAALVGGGAVALVAGSARVAQVNPFAPAGLALGVGAAALFAAKSGNSQALHALGYAAMGVGALLGYSGYQAYQGMKQTTGTHGHSASSIVGTHGHSASAVGADLHSIVGYWIAQNVVPPQRGGFPGFARNTQETDMSGQRMPGAWAGVRRP